jgi:hypothetical protein
MASPVGQVPLHPPVLGSLHRELVRDLIRYIKCFTPKALHPVP